ERCGVCGSRNVGACAVYRIESLTQRVIGGTIRLTVQHPQRHLTECVGGHEPLQVRTKRRTPGSCLESAERVQVSRGAHIHVGGAFHEQIQCAPRTRALPLCTFCDRGQQPCLPSGKTHYARALHVVVQLEYYRVSSEQRHIDCGILLG